MKKLAREYKGENDPGENTVKFKISAALTRKKKKTYWKCKIMVSSSSIPADNLAKRIQK